MPKRAARSAGGRPLYKGRISKRAKIDPILEVLDFMEVRRLVVGSTIDNRGRAKGNDGSRADGVS